MKRISFLLLAFTLSFSVGLQAQSFEARVEAIASQPYTVYTALLTQTGTDAPVATVLQNTLGGEVVWSYDSPGYYLGTLAGAFPAGRVVCFLTNGLQTGLLMGVIDTAPNVFSVFSYDAATSTPTDGIMGEASIEIRQYPAP